MAESRVAFREATDAFTTVLAAVQPDLWQQPGLGEWTVRDLVGHASRGLLTVESYLAQPAERIDVPDAITYFITGLSVPGANELVAQRGREAGASLGPDPLSAVRELAARVLPKVEQAADDQLLTTSVGGMRLAEYLPTRVFELTVHTLDLAAAIGLPLAPPPTAARICLEIVVGLTFERGVSGQVLSALTGRQNLPAGFSVL